MDGGDSLPVPHHLGLVIVFFFFFNQHGQRNVPKLFYVLLYSPNTAAITSFVPLAWANSASAFNGFIVRC